MQARFSVASQRRRTAFLSCTEKRCFLSRVPVCLGACVLVSGGRKGNVTAPMRSNDTVIRQ